MWVQGHISGHSSFVSDEETLSSGKHGPDGTVRPPARPKVSRVLQAVPDAWPAANVDAAGPARPQEQLVSHDSSGVLHGQ